MRVIEQFLSIQGEGIMAGAPSWFIRLSGCDMQPPCRWCDTKYSTDVCDGEEIPIHNLLINIANQPAKQVVITGGEPLMQQDEVFQLMDELSSYSYTIETNGLHFPPAIKKRHNDNLLMSVSPKLPSSGYYEPLEFIPALRLRYEHVDVPIQWKFVVADQDDFDTLEQDLIKNKFDESDVVILQPCSLKGSLSYPELIALAKERLWPKNIQAWIVPQLHVIAWPHIKRGV
jgi:7-carboxy-7-deazaguanine synthase